MCLGLDEVNHKIELIKTAEVVQHCSFYLHDKGFDPRANILNFLPGFFGSSSFQFFLEAVNIPFKLLKVFRCHALKRLPFLRV